MYQVSSSIQAATSWSHECSPKCRLSTALVTAIVPMVLVPASPTATKTTSTAPADGRPNGKAQLQPDAISGLNTNTECGDEDRQRQRRPYTALRAGRQHAKRTRESRRAWIHALRRTIRELETEQREIQESGRYKWCNNIAAAAGPRTRSCGAVAAGRVPPLSDAPGRLTTAAAAAPLTTCQVTVNGRFVEQQPSAAAAGASRSTQSATAALELWRSLKQHNNNNNNNHRQRADLFDTQVASSASELYETHPPSTVHRYDDPLGLTMAPFLLLHHERHSKRRQPPQVQAQQHPTTSQLLPHHPSGARATSVGGVVAPTLDSTTTVAPALTSSASDAQVRRAATAAAAAAAGTDELSDRRHNHKTSSWPGRCNNAGRTFPEPKQYRDIPPRTTGRGYGGLDAVCGVLSDQHLLDRVRLSTSLRLRHKLQVRMPPKCCVLSVECLEWLCAPPPAWRTAVYVN
jgi:hypothetical protein